MHQKYKDKQGKAKKWIKTRYAKPYLFELGFKSIQARMIAAQGIHQVNVIRGTVAPRTQKAQAIAGALIEAFAGVANVYTEKPLTKARPTGK